MKPIYARSMHGTNQETIIIQCPNQYNQLLMTGIFFSGTKSFYLEKLYLVAWEGFVQSIDSQNWNSGGQWGAYNYNPDNCKRLDLLQGKDLNMDPHQDLLPFSMLLPKGNEYRCTLHIEYGVQQTRHSIGTVWILGQFF